MYTYYSFICTLKDKKQWVYKVPGFQSAERKQITCSRIVSLTLLASFSGIFPTDGFSHHPTRDFWTALKEPYFIQETSETFSTANINRKQNLSLFRILCGKTVTAHAWSKIWKRQQGYSHNTKKRRWLYRYLVLCPFFYNECVVTKGLAWKCVIASSMVKIYLNIDNNFCDVYFGGEAQPEKSPSSLIRVLDIRDLCRAMRCTCICP